MKSFRELWVHLTRRIPQVEPWPEGVEFRGVNSYRVWLVSVGWPVPLLQLAPITPSGFDLEVLGPCLLSPSAVEAVLAGARTLWVFRRPDTSLPVSYRAVPWAMPGGVPVGVPEDLYPPLGRGEAEDTRPPQGSPK